MLVGHVRALNRYPVKSMAGEAIESSRVELDGLTGDRAFAVRDDKAGELRSARRWPRLLQCTARYRSEPGQGSLPSAEITLPDGSTIGTDDPAASRLLSSWLGLAATLYPRLPASNKQHYRRSVPGASAAGVLVKTGLSKMVNRLAQLGPSGEQLRRDLGREQDEPLPDFSGMPGVFEFVSPPGTYFDAFPIHFITTSSLAALRAKHPSGDWDERRFRANLIIQTDAQLTGYVETGWVGRTLRIGETELECVLGTPRCSVVMREQGDLPQDPVILRTIVRDAAQNLGLYARVRTAGRVKLGDAVTF